MKNNGMINPPYNSSVPVSKVEQENPAKGVPPDDFQVGLTKG